MSAPQIPLVVLGGRDRRGSTLPESGRDKQPLRGYKGADLEIDGRPLIVELIERMRRSGVFGPIFVAGPMAVYRDLVGAEAVIDTDGEFGDNLRASLEGVDIRCDSSMVAFTTCDILPDEAELETALSDLRQHLPLYFWMPQCRVPDDYRTLGASHWKPTYSLRPPGAEEPVPILPGHIVVANYKALRKRFVFRFFDLLYKTRNRPVLYRALVLTRAMLWALALEDIKSLLRLRVPHILLPVVYHSLTVAARLRRGNITTTEMERHLRIVFLKHGHRKQNPQLRGYISIVDGLSLAKDIDTVEEAREVTGVGAGVAGRQDE